VLCYYDDAPSEGATEPLYSSKTQTDHACTCVQLAVGTLL